MAVFQEPFDISIEALISIKIVISVETETIIIFTRIFISALDPLTPAKCQKKTEWQTLNKTGWLGRHQIKFNQITT